MINLKNNKGAITLYILVSLLFFIIAIVSVQANLKTKEANLELEYQKIKTSYEKDANEAYDNINTEEITIASLKASGKKVTGSKVTLLDKDDNQIVIPVGFKIKSDSPTLVKDGIVVVAPDKNESEFVWIPVEDVSKMYGIREVTVDETTQQINTGKLYEFSTSGYSALNWTEEDGKMSWTKDYKERETDILTDTTDNGDATDTGLNFLKSIIGIEGTVGEDNEEMLNTWSSQLQSEFDKMITSVKDNKGFYVGRYETSLREEKDENGNTIKIAQSIKNVQSANSTVDSANTWYGFYQLERDYSKNNELENIIGSSMIWGSQYDQMMILMQENEIDVTATTLIEEGKNNLTQITGAVETDKINNVYDLLGGNYEWTLEAIYTNNRTYRGNCCEHSYSASTRLCSTPNENNTAYGSRLSIYIQ